MSIINRPAKLLIRISKLRRCYLRLPSFERIRG